jgi:hypothetical protein
MPETFLTPVTREDLAEIHASLVRTEGMLRGLVGGRVMMEDIQLMKQALLDSGLIGRYCMYARRIPTMQETPDEQIAAEWAPLVVKAYMAVSERMPLYMVCGCVEGSHPNTVSDVGDRSFAHGDRQR